MGIAALHDTCEAVKQQQKQHFKTILMPLPALIHWEKIKKRLELSTHTYAHSLTWRIFHLNATTFDF